MQVLAFFPRGVRNARFRYAQMRLRASIALTRFFLYLILCDSASTARRAEKWCANCRSIFCARTCKSFQLPQHCSCLYAPRESEGACTICGIRLPDKRRVGRKFATRFAFAGS